MSSAIFPRAEVASAELVTFEVAYERGIVSDGDLASAGTGAAACVGAPLQSAVLTSSGLGTTGITGAALAQAALAATGIGATSFPATMGKQAAMTSAGMASSRLDGITYYVLLPLGPEPMTRGGEVRSMSRNAEGRAMTDGVYDPLARGAEQRGMTK